MCKSCGIAIAYVDKHWKLQKRYHRTVHGLHQLCTALGVCDGEARSSIACLPAMTCFRITALSTCSISAPCVIQT